MESKKLKALVIGATGASGRVNFLKYYFYDLGTCWSFNLK